MNGEREALAGEPVAQSQARAFNPAARAGPMLPVPPAEPPVAQSQARAFNPAARAGAMLPVPPAP